MKDEPKKTAGTEASEANDTEPVATDADERASDTAEGDQEQEFIRVKRHDYLTHKEKAERVNQLEREKADLEERLRERSATEAPQMTQADAELRELNDEYQRLQQEAASFVGADGRTYAGSAAAKTALRLIADRIHEKQETRDELWLLDATTIDEESGQERALTREEKRLVREVRDRDRIPAALALDRLEAKRSREVRVQAAKRKREADEVVEGRERGDVIRTRKRDETPTEARNRHMSLTDYQRRIAQLEETGKGVDADKLAREVASGKVILD